MTKTKKIDSNSTENQRIKSKFVEREVLACFSHEMEAVLRAGAESNNKDYPLPQYDEIENLYEYKCPNCGEGFQDTDALYDKEKDKYVCSSCKHEVDEFDQEPQEIYEWWIVTEYLYDKLKAKGHPVLEWGNNHYWGRCASGQAIMLDSVITEICRDMEILEGQVNDWSK